MDTSTPLAAAVGIASVATVWIAVRLLARQGRVHLGRVAFWEYRPVKSSTKGTIPHEIDKSAAWQSLSSAQDDESNASKSARIAFLVSRYETLFLSLAAVLILAAQKVWFHLPSASGTAFLFAELSVLLLLAYDAVAGKHTSQEWVERRLRSELLRRERALLLAGAGPYSTTRIEAAHTVALQRIAFVQAASLEDLRKDFKAVALELSSESDAASRGAVRPNTGAPHTQPAQPTDQQLQSSRIAAYCSHRVERELAWFHQNALRCREESTRRRRVAVGLPLLALLVVVLRLALVAPTHEPLQVIASALEFVAFVIIAAALAVHFLGLLSSTRPRTELYSMTYKRLKEASLPLLMIRDTPAQASALPLHTFHACVLRCENVMAEQAIAWSALMANLEEELN